MSGELWVGSERRLGKMKRLLRCVSLFVLLLCAGFVRAEKVADLPAPTGYVNDFAGVLSSEGRERIAALCAELDRQAGSQIAVVTIKTLDDDQTIEDFSVALEEKWKVGKKGTDKGLLFVVVLNPKKVRAEVGYGLEGALNDAKVGDILRRDVDPSLSQGDYDRGVFAGVQDFAQVIAKDANVTLAPLPDPYSGQVVHQYHRQGAPQQGIGIGGLIGGGIVILLLLLMIATGNGGWIWMIIMMLMNGGGGGGGGRGGGDGDGGGGFGGFGGGSSGGGGASSDY